MKWLEIIIKNMNVFDKIKEKDGKIYFVGGVVRDRILNRQSKDIDILVDNISQADLEEILLPEGYDFVGRSFGTYKGKDIEFSLPRKDRKIGSGHKDFEIELGATIKEDIQRRDFTMNSLLMDEYFNIIDFTGQGLIDIKDGVIRPLHSDTYKEDPLRMLRAMRFQSQLGFTIFNGDLLCDSMYLINTISRERIHDEFNKLLLGEHVGRVLENATFISFLYRYIPNMYDLICSTNYNTKHHFTNTYDHTRRIVNSIEPLLELRLAAFFHDIAKPLTESIGEDGIYHNYGHEALGAKITFDIMTKMGYSNDMVDTVTNLVKYHMTIRRPYTLRRFRRVINERSKEFLSLLIRLVIEDSRHTKTGIDESEIKEIRDLYDKACELPNKPRDLQIDGNDIMRELNINTGVIVGTIIHELIEKVLDDSSLNEKGKLLELARKIYREL